MPPSAAHMAPELMKGECNTCKKPVTVFDLRIKKKETVTNKETGENEEKDVYYHIAKDCIPKKYLQERGKCTHCKKDIFAPFPRIKDGQKRYFHGSSDYYKRSCWDKYVEKEETRKEAADLKKYSSKYIADDAEEEGEENSAEDEEEKRDESREKKGRRRKRRIHENDSDLDDGKEEEKKKKRRKTKKNSEKDEVQKDDVEKDEVGKNELGKDQENGEKEEEEA